MEKVMITSITASNFVQDPKRPTVDHMELCRYCANNHAPLPECCITCGRHKIVTCSDGKTFDCVLEADLHCKRLNGGNINACI